MIKNVEKVSLLQNETRIDFGVVPLIYSKAMRKE